MGYSFHLSKNNFLLKVNYPQVHPLGARTVRSLYALLAQVHHHK